MLDSCRFLAPPPEAVDFTLVSSKYKSGIGTAAIDGEDDQMLSLIHHNRLKEIIGKTMLNHLQNLWDHVSAEIQGYTTKRTGLVAPLTFRDCAQ